MATLQLEQNTMKNSTEYLPILRSVLKSQIQFLVEQLSDAGEETFILSANVKDGAVEQLGSESGKLFANVYDDFKSEFLGFCQRRQGKRKLESPQKTPVDAKRGKAAPAVMAVKSPQNVPKVSSARVIMSHKQASSATSTAGNQGIQPSDQPGIVELGESGEDYSEVEDTGLGYEELQDVQTWEGEEQSQDTSTISQVAPSGSKGTSTSVQKKIVTTIQRSKIRRFTCNKCGKSFNTSTNLKRHTLRHGEKTFTCDRCLKKFFTITELRQHKSCMHVEGEKKTVRRFACEFCGSRYARKVNLLHHIRVKHEKAEKNLFCEICIKPFRSKWSLYIHKKRHGEKTVQCSVCAKLFYTLTELKQHENHTHNKEPIAKVAVKEQQNTPVNLEKMFSKAVSCPECGKLFIRADALELHVLSHTDEYPFVCQLCGLGYRKKRSYAQHISKKHPEVQVDDQ